MAVPPLLAGAAHETVAWPLPALALTAVGAPGTVIGVTPKGAFVELAESSFRAIGAPEPERRAPIAVAAINGILLDRLRGVGEDPAATMADHLNELFALLLEG